MTKTGALMVTGVLAFAAAVCRADKPGETAPVPAPAPPLVPLPSPGPVPHAPGS